MVFKKYHETDEDSYYFGYDVIEIMDGGRLLYCGFYHDFIDTLLQRLGLEGEVQM